MRNSKTKLFVLVVMATALASTMMLGCGEVKTTELDAPGEQAEAAVEQFSADEELAITEELEEAVDQEINLDNAEAKLVELEKEIDNDQD